FFFFQAEDGIRDFHVTGVQTCALPIFITEFRQIMAAHGLDKPIWLVETNAPPVDDPDWPVPEYTLAVTLEEQAAFMPQAMAAARSEERRVGKECRPRLWE